MDILERIRKTALSDPQRIAIRTDGEMLSYGGLWSASGALAAWLLQREAEAPGEKSEGQQEERMGRYPVAVYGHKSPWMLVCFLGLIRSGHAYCPIDVSVPENRAMEILKALPSALVLAADDIPAGLTEAFAGEKEFAGADRIREICARYSSREPEEGMAVRGEDLFYLIFTSGSTGVPKGVEITANCLNHFLDWSVRLLGEGEGTSVFLNQAPFSFDLSVMDLYTCLASGGTLYCLTRQTQSDYRSLMAALKDSNASVWVSTPSFAEMCLAEPSFRREIMPGLQTFAFCGETLANRTAAKLLKAFPGVKVYNTYGPTESTVAVTGVLVTEKLLLEQDPLPVGEPKPGTVIEIRDEDGKPVPEGEKGEIVILGDTVSTGYYRQPELTAKAFLREDAPAGGRSGDAAGGLSISGEASPGCGGNRVRAYRTGDEGYLRNGMLYYCGRIDLQVKLHGYRIELEDIESNLLKNPLLSQAVVVPNARGGKIVSLTAYVVPAKAWTQQLQDGVAKTKGEPSVLCSRMDPKLAREMGDQVKEELAKQVPLYMVPKKILFLDAIPMTANGKADRKALKRQEKPI